MQSTLPHVLVTVVPHWVPHLGRSQQSPFTHCAPDAHVYALDPQVLVAVPQNVGVGRGGRAQHVPAPAAPVVVHPKPLPQEVAEHVFEPQVLVTVVLHAAPSPPQVGSTQHVPGVLGSG